MKATKTRQIDWHLADVVERTQPNKPPEFTDEYRAWLSNLTELVALYGREEAERRVGPRPQRLKGG
jgi:hypothetical protein